MEEDERDWKTGSKRSAEVSLCMPPQVREDSGRRRRERRRSAETMRNAGRQVIQGNSGVFALSYFFFLFHCSRVVRQGAEGKESASVHQFLASCSSTKLWKSHSHTVTEFLLSEKLKHALGWKHNRIVIFFFKWSQIFSSLLRFFFFLKHANVNIYNDNHLLHILNFVVFIFLHFWCCISCKLAKSHFSSHFGWCNTRNTTLIHFYIIMGWQNAATDETTFSRGQF